MTAADHFVTDYFLIGLVVAVSLVGVMQIICKRTERLAYKHAVLFLIGGIAIVSLATTANSIIEHRWALPYVGDFLLLKRVSTDWFFRHLCSWGYIFTAWELAMLYSASASNRAEV